GHQSVAFAWTPGPLVAGAGRRQDDLHRSRPGSKRRRSRRPLPHPVRPPERSDGPQARGRRTLTTLPQAAQKILDGTAPEPLRKGIAAGAVPMPPADLVSALAVLIARDPDPVLRAKALESLQQMPENVRKAALEGPLAAPVFRVVLKQIALQPDEREA